MSDIVFVTPNRKCTVRGEPIGTLILASILRNAGLSVEILPLGIFGEINDDLDRFLTIAEHRILNKNAKIVSFYTRCDIYHIDIRIAERIKQRNKHLQIVFGGPQSDLCAEDTLRAFDCVDFICRGEGETTVLPFFTSLLQDCPDYSIPGLAYKNGEEIILNPRPKHLDDFSDVSPIDYSLLEEAGDRLSGTGMEIDVGRGCPFSCTFCSTKSFWNRNYRLKSPELIVAEMTRLHEKFQIEDFDFEHDMFTMNRNRVIQICEMIMKLPFRVRWTCSARLDCLDEELIDIMYSAGFRGVYIGIESGSTRIQKLINKNLDLSRAESIVSYLDHKNIRTTVSFIYGFPEETEEDLSQTIALWIKLSRYPTVGFQWHLLAFFPGTELESKYRGQLSPVEKFSNETGDFGATECMDMINANPTVFPQYRSYKTTLRKNADRLTAFLRIFKQAFPAFEYLLGKYFVSPFEMYMLWKKTVFSDSDEVNSGNEADIIARSMGFVDLFSEDSKYPLLTEIFRYLTDKERFSDGSNASSEGVYHFAMQDYLDKVPLEQFANGIAIVSFSRNKNGKICENVRSSRI